jgi:NADH-quinone oxidoreductase subunit C
MSIKVNIEISVANEGYTEHEAAILAALAAHPSQGAAAVTPVAVAPVATVTTTPAPAIDLTARTKEAADARIAESKAKTAADAKAKAAAAAKAKAAEAAAAAAEAEAAEAEVEEAEVEDDLLGGEAETTFTKADAIAKATQLVSSQKQAVVKTALAAVGAKRVSDLNDAADIQAFMAALEA